MSGGGKFALVTGASTGIGRATAIELGKKRWAVGLVARREGELKRTKDLVDKAGGVGICLVADLTNVKDIKSLVSNISRLDLLVNVAGVWHGKDEVYAGKDIKDFDWQVIRHTYLVGVVAPTILVSGLVTLMPKGSAIVNISGTFESGAKGWLPYYVSKRAIEDLTIGLAQELEEKGIRVNCVSPSDVATEEYKKYFPEDAQNALIPEEVARFVLDVSEESETGKVWVIKEGKKMREGFHK